ncbi:MAG: repair protein RecO [Planctomycetota bacterium]
MSFEKCQAVVLRTVEWSETSLIVTLFTDSFGKIGAIAKGAKRLKSPFESALDLLSRSSVVFMMKSGDSLDLLLEAKLQRRFRGVQAGLLPLYCGYYAGELINALTENHQPIPGMLDSLSRTLEQLETGNHPAETILNFELDTIRRLGHLPSWQWCVACGEAIENDRPTVAFSTAGGGVVCPQCVPMHRQILRIQGKTLQILMECSHRAECSDGEQMVRESTGLSTSTPPNVRSEIRTVMESILQYHADRRLRMLEYLEDLKR